MATFEVFVPVRGEVIFTVEADNHIDAQEIAMELDFSEGEPNIEWDDADEIRSEILSGDDDDYADGFLPITLNMETDETYAMRHYRF